MLQTEERQTKQVTIKQSHTSIHLSIPQPFDQYIHPPLSPSIHPSSHHPSFHPSNRTSSSTKTDISLRSQWRPKIGKRAGYHIHPMAQPKHAFLQFFCKKKPGPTSIGLFLCIRAEVFIRGNSK